MAGFLGINITRDEQNNSLTMTQTGLIEQILSAMDMEDCNHKYTPADKDPLCKDVDGARLGLQVNCRDYAVFVWKY